MNDPKPVMVVVAQQRSGTTVLYRTLSAGSVIQGYGEIFHDDTDAAGNFFAFKIGRVAADPRLLVPAPENQARLWRDYLAFARSATEKPVVMIDIKYNGWHHLNPVRHPIGATPDLVKMVRADLLPVIHVIRDDLFSQACSFLVAERRSVFHVERDQADAVGRHELRPQQILAWMERSVRQTKQFRGFFSGHARYAELRYEAMLEGDRLAPLTLETLSRLAGFPLDEGQPTPLRKVLPDLRQVLDNADEVVAFFDQTPYAQMVRNALGAA